MVSFYEKEDSIFAYENEIFITNDRHNVEKVIKKIARHYGFKFEGLKYRKMKTTYMKTTYGIAKWDNTIILNSSCRTRLLTIIHECAHLLKRKKYKNKHFHYHDKKLMSCIKRIAKYVKYNKSIKELLEVEYK